MSLISLLICDYKKKNKRAKPSEIDGDDQRRPYLSEELVLQNIVIRLSAMDLAKWSCVSKYWYKSILSDSRFASSHFDHNKNKLNLVFNLLNVSRHGRSECHFLNIEQGEEDDDDDDDNGFLLNYRPLINTSSLNTDELVGYCNGLVCTKQVGYPGDESGEFSILNPTRAEMLSYSYEIPRRARRVCHGFCFDSVLQRYKVVLIYATITAGAEQELVCMVLTLGVRGTDACRTRITTTDGLVTNCSRSSRGSATLCGGDLLWRITVSNINYNNAMDVLLLFNVREERLDIISLPAECNLARTTTTTTNEHQSIVIDHHLLEFKGYPCVARSEKIMTRRSRHHRHGHWRRHLRSGKRSSFCCCGFRVQLFVLKDNVNKVWVKEETFDLQIKEGGGLLPAPFCCYFDTTTTAALPTRILSFSDQLLLYWTDGEYLLLYNLHMKQLKVVKCTGVDGDIFETKMREPIRQGRMVGDEKYPNFPYADYQLHAQPENILSLKSFIPEGGETRKFVSPWNLEQSMRNGKIEVPGGILNTPRELLACHALY